LGRLRRRSAIARGASRQDQAQRYDGCWAASSPRTAKAPPESHTAYFLRRAEPNVSVAASLVRLIIGSRHHYRSCRWGPPGG
jgi:hypothetical protein